MGDVRIVGVRKRCVAVSDVDLGPGEVIRSREVAARRATAVVGVEVQGVVNVTERSGRRDCVELSADAR